MLAALHYTSLQTAFIPLSLFFTRAVLLSALPSSFTAALYVCVIAVVHRELPGTQHRPAAAAAAATPE